MCLFGVGTTEHFVTNWNTQRFALESNFCSFTAAIECDSHVSMGNKCLFFCVCSKRIFLCDLNFVHIFYFTFFSLSFFFFSFFYGAEKKMLEELTRAYIQSFWVECMCVFFFQCFLLCFVMKEEMRGASRRSVGVLFFLFLLHLFVTESEKQDTFSLRSYSLLDESA
jgi:hypothetical protein